MGQRSPLPLQGPYRRLRHLSPSRAHRRRPWAARLPHLVARTSSSSQPSALGTSLGPAAATSRADATDGGTFPGRGSRASMGCPCSTAIGVLVSSPSLATQEQVLQVACCPRCWSRRGRAVARPPRGAGSDHVGGSRAAWRCKQTDRQFIFAFRLVSDTKCVMQLSAPLECVFLPLNHYRLPILRMGRGMCSLLELV